LKDEEENDKGSKVVETEVKSILLTNKYMTAHIHGLVQKHSIQSGKVN